MKTIEVLIIGAGAAGLMCAIEAGKRHRKVIIIDHNNKPGKKILMSGGGRCNFTNLNIRPECYLSHNPHFCKSALKRYTQWDFIELVKKHQIPYHEKKHGQLFCDNKAKDILNVLLQACENEKVAINLEESIESIEKFCEHAFKITTNKDQYICESIVVATGGLSIPTLGATPFGYKVAAQFNIPVYPVRAGLVALTLQEHDKERFSLLPGVSVDCFVTSQKQSFRENLLFTHRGLSGPAILQISNYWESGQDLVIDLLPQKTLKLILQEAKKKKPKTTLKDFLGKWLPKSVIPVFLENVSENTQLVSLSQAKCEQLSQSFHEWRIKPNATEGYRTAEVTLGGVDCNALSSKTMESNVIKGLYFIGEVVDVSGWLGGYNFQWAWSSGWAAGQVV